jgi:tetratricopeptide (TPR) repeat protein
LKVDPKMPDAHFSLGYLLWTLKQTEEAARELQTELDNNPDHASAMTYLADIDLQLGRNDAALPLLEKATKLDPSIALAHLDLGILYAGADRQDEGLREMKEAERLDSGDVNVHWRLGRLYRSMGKSDEAKAEFAKASQITKATDQSLLDQIDKGKARQAPAPPPVDATPAVDPSAK